MKSFSLRYTLLTFHLDQLWLPAGLWALFAIISFFRGGAVNALNDIRLHIEAGMFDLLGTNGAGKTTLTRILAGIVNPSSGEVRVSGHNLATETGKQAVKSTLGYLPQELGMYPEVTAAQFVDYMAILKGMDDS